MTHTWTQSAPSSHLYIYYIFLILVYYIYIYIYILHIMEVINSISNIKHETDFTSNEEYKTYLLENYSLILNELSAFKKKSDDYKKFK